MLWFCCFALFREKKFKANAQMLVKSIKETEMNLRKLGIVIDAQKGSCGEKEYGEELLVRDKLKIKNEKKKNDSISRTMNRLGKLTNPPAVKTSENYEMSDRIELTNEETSRDLLDCTQPYDMLDSNRPTVQTRRKKTVKEGAVKEELLKTQPTETSAQKPNEQINEAFVNDEDELLNNRATSLKKRNEKGEYVSHVPTFNYLKPSNNGESSEIALSRIKSTNVDNQVGYKRSNESRAVNKNKTYGNQTDSLKRREMPNNHGNSTRIQSSSLTRKVNQMPSSVHRLSREQIEKEFYEYTLECRKRIKELFSDSSVSSLSAPSEHEYTSFNDEHVTPQQRASSNAHRNRRSSLQKTKRSMSSPYGSIGVEQVWRV